MRAAQIILIMFAMASIASPAAAQEGQLNIYNWADYIGKDTVSNFEHASGIKVVYDTYDSDASLEAKVMAGDSGYDLVTTSTDFFSRQIKAGVYQTIDKSKLPNWKNLDPAILAVMEKFDPGNISNRFLATAPRQTSGSFK